VARVRYRNVFYGGDGIRTRATKAVLVFGMSDFGDSGGPYYVPNGSTASTSTALFSGVHQGRGRFNDGTLFKAFTPFSDMGGFQPHTS